MEGEKSVDNTLDSHASPAPSPLSEGIALKVPEYVRMLNTSSLERRLTKMRSRSPRT